MNATPPQTRRFFNNKAKEIDITNIIGTIITDCADNDTRARQELRFDALFGGKPTFLGIEAFNTLQAAGNLVDQLDVLTNFPHTAHDRKNVVLVNVAPRAAEVKHKWDNGTPFCYFRLSNTLVVSTYEGYCLTLVRDLGLASEVALLDIPTVTAAAVAWGELTSAEAEKINHTQFRSLEFLPLVAYWIAQGREVPSKRQLLDELPDVHNRVWLVDNFSLVKTTLLPEEIGFAAGKQLALADGTIATCYARLTDVPDGVTALTIGSSGYGAKRFIEVAIGGRGRAGDTHDLHVGDSVLHTARLRKEAKL